MKAHNILETIGNTPHVKVNRLFDPRVDVWIKLERANPGGSIKDRIALAMVEDAEEKGLINSDTVIVEPTSGNTGIGLAMVAAAKGYKIILVMPESMSLERRRYLTALGAQLELTPKEKGMKGSISRAEELLQEHPNSWMLNQFENGANPASHRRTTAQEIIRDFPDGIDYLMTGVGTGGHITGCAQVLKEKFSNIKVFAVEPDTSAVISGGNPGPHSIQGIGAGFLPGVLDTKILDGTIRITNEEAFRFAARCVKEEGIFVGISSGASLAAVHKKIPELPDGSRIVTFCYDTGERYLSIQGLFE